MKHYLKGGLVLAAILMGLVFAILKSHWYLDNTLSILMRLKNTSKGNRSSYELIEQGLLAKRPMMELMETFLGGWEPFLKKSSDPNKVLNDMIELSFSNTVAISEKTAQRLKMKEGGLVKESISISLKALGKFERIYAWLGAVEEAYPHAKINELNLMTENMNAALTLRLQVPIMI